MNAYLTVDLGFGDAGKGSIVDFLARETDAHTVIRFNGGAQAGHHVVTADGREHVFSQFGAGTLAGAATHLSRFHLLDPLAMEAEADHLITLTGRNPFEATTIDENALVVTPFQRAANRLKELARGEGRHGSCGMGIGETMADSLAHGDQVLFARDLGDVDRLWRKLSFLREVNLAKVRDVVKQLSAHANAQTEIGFLLDDFDWLLDAYLEFARNAHIVPSRHLTTILNRSGSVVFEAAQGVLLDEWFGFHPHTTWSTTTLANAETLLREAAYQGDVTRIGITRAYATRHGAGPFVTEQPELAKQLPDAVNGFDAWQHGFRVGWLDLVMLDYALKVTGQLDMLAVTCLDRLADLDTLQVCTRYQGTPVIEPAPTVDRLDYQARLTKRLFDCVPVFEAVNSAEILLNHISTATSLPIGITSYSPTAQDKRFFLSRQSQSL